MAQDAAAALRADPSAGAEVQDRGKSSSGGQVNTEIKRRTDAVEMSPNAAALLRLAGCVLIEIDDEWQVSDRRYPFKRLHG